jgi:hypothetical protein
MHLFYKSSFEVLVQTFVAMKLDKKDDPDDVGDAINNSLRVVNALEILVQMTKKRELDKQTVRHVVF